MHQDAGDNPEEKQPQDPPLSPQSRVSVAAVMSTTELSPTNSSSNDSSSDSWISCHEESHDTGLDRSDDVRVSLSVSDVPSSPETLLSCWIRLQAQGDLYRGVGPVVTTMAASNFVFFFVHQALKRFESKKRKSMWQAIVVSTLAGVVNVLVTNPLWVANLRIMKGSANNNLLSELRSIVQKEGVASLWNGTTSSLLLVSNPVIQFFWYEQLKQLLVARRPSRRSSPQHGPQLAPLEAFILGAIAKAIATIVTYPLQLSQVLLRLQESNSDNFITTVTASPNDRSLAFSGTVSCWRHLLKNKGVPALFTGLEAKLLQTCLTAALTFCTYEQLLRFVQRALLSIKRAVQA